MRRGLLQAMFGAACQFVEVMRLAKALVNERLVRSRRQSGSGKGSRVEVQFWFPRAAACTSEPTDQQGFLIRLKALKLSALRACFLPEHCGFSWIHQLSVCERQSLKLPLDLSEQASIASRSPS